MGKLEAIYNRSPVLLQTVLLNFKAAELYAERYGRKFWKLFEQFDKNQWLSPTELETYQDEKLRILLDHAFNEVPYYHELMKTLRLGPSDFKTKADLHKLPVLTKDDIRKHRTRMISRRYPKLLLRHGHTSGTTGSPLDFYYNIQTCIVHHVADWRQKQWAGLKYGDWYATLLGRVIVPIEQTRPPFWRRNYINNQLFLSSFHLQEENLPSYFAELRKANILTIEAYPSTAYILALYLNQKGQKLPLRSVLTTSETLFSYQREAIESAFCCKVFDTYGMSERVALASECDHHSGHHLNSDYGITEFLDSSDEPVSEGRLGKIVATGLYNFAMPLIRYETNDACSIKAEGCTCGRGFTLMDDVTTKSESIVTLADGRLISPSVLTHPFKPMDNIAESQIIQESLQELVVKVVRREHYSTRDEKALIAGFHERLGDRINIKVEYVDSIPRTSNGKFKWVVSKVTPNFTPSH